MQDLQRRFNSALKRISEKYKLDLKQAAAAVSGGADSLALALLLKGWADENGGRLAVLTVNHHLRPEADEEAAYVAALMKKQGIEQHILDWRHEDLHTGIETKARQARYRLLTRWCREHDFPFLLTAHHLRDQAETFIMRLQRGSGLDGLAAMSEATSRGGVTLVRPLLEFEPQELRDFLIERGIEWKEDKSNDCDDFLRVRVRKMLPLLERELGLTPAKIGAAAAALSGAREYFTTEVERFVSRHCRLWYQTAWSFSPTAFRALADELKFRVLARLIKSAGGLEYAPEYAALQRLRNNLENGAFSGCTLGGCEILRYDGKIWLLPERKSQGVLGRRQWAEFAACRFPELKGEIPYKLRLILYEKNSKAVEFEK